MKCELCETGKVEVRVMSDLTEKERKIINENLEEGRRAIQYIVWQMNHTDTEILIPRRGRGG